MISFFRNRFISLRIEVYNATGQKIETIVDANLKAGEYHYHFSAKEAGFGAGIYLVKITEDQHLFVRKVIEME